MLNHIRSTVPFFNYPILLGTWTGIAQSFSLTLEVMRGHTTMRYCRVAGNTCLDFTNVVAVPDRELSESLLTDLDGDCRGPFKDTIPVFVWNT